MYVCAYSIFCPLCSCSLLFFTAPHFHLAGRSFLPLAFLIVSPPVWIFMFFFLQNSSLLFSITRSSSFSVIHVSINIKYNVEKDTTLLIFLSFLKSRRPCDFVAFRLPYLLIELFYIGIPVVWTDFWTVNRSVGVQSRDYQIFSDG